MFAIPYHFDSLRLFRAFKHENSKHVIVESPDSSQAFFNQHCTGVFFVICGTAPPPVQSTAWACSAALISMIYALGVMEAKIGMNEKTPLEYPKISIFEANMFH